MEDILAFVRINAPVILVLFVAVFSILFLRLFGKNAAAARWAAALPFIFEAIRDFVERADQLHDQILLDYADEAAETGDDPRLLWVIDRVEEFALKHFRVSVDLNWVIDQVELYLNRTVSVDDPEELEAIDEAIRAHRSGVRGEILD